MKKKLHSWLILMIVCIAFVATSIQIYAAETSIEITNQNQSNGTATIVIKDVPTSITSVKVPIWSTANGQNDIVWYTASQIDSTSYQVNLNISNHSFTTGDYTMHAYGYDANNNSTFLSSGTCTFNVTEASIQVTEASTNSGSYTISGTGIRTSSDCVKVHYAVWSSANGQNDLKWYEATYNASSNSWDSTFSLENHDGYGTYIVHAYALSSADQQVNVGDTTFHTDTPTCSNISVVTDNASGTFTITISGIDADAGIKEILVPVWNNTNGQDDIVWYTASKSSADTYTVTSTINKHDNMTGGYSIHGYVQDSYGTLRYLDSVSTSFTDLPIALTATDVDNTETNFLLNLTGTMLQTGSSHIAYAVWSESGGQDDLVWYEGEENGYAANSLSIPVSNHATYGTYQVHAYEVGDNGSMTFLSKTTFSVDERPSATISVSEVNSETGAFTVTIDNIYSPSGIDKIQVPVWSSSNQSDITWYTASKVDDNTYSVDVNISAHNYTLGDYTIHAYVTMGNGIRSFVSSTTADIYVQNYLSVEYTKSGSRTLTLVNPSTTSATSVYFPVWSSTNGQDDVKWYKATKLSNGNWTATISTTNLDNYGTVIAHAYVNNKYVAKASFDVSSSEIKKNGWYYEDGYKFYYKNGVKQTDLDGILTKQSSYYIKVNRTTCTVTVYAKDGSNGYIIPVKVFACSVGLSSTPTPTGTFTTSDKYRWHTLMGPSYGQYCTRITDGILFHSVAGYNMTSYNISASAYNKLGEPASHGCVRLTVADAKWIYDYCKSGTTVKIFDSTASGPFPKPSTIKIPSTQNWDPTDPAVK